MRRLAAALVMTIALAPFAAPAHEQIHPRIVNGVTTQEQVTTGALLLQTLSGLRQICSGTLIGCETFLTAAHCVCANGDFASCGTPSPGSYRVYLQHAGILAVASIDVHPGYDFATSGDIAVLTLAAPLTGVPPTPINTTGTPAFGTTGTLAGFGVTAGGRNDSGVKREGRVVTASCAGVVPEPAHVCWELTSPLGPPGEDSNTCFGDSGGPLFVDLGGGDVVAGVTSGGLSGTCLPFDLSFDANVFENAAFIQSVGGADLMSTACGTISQVGDVDTEVTAVDFVGVASSSAKCRKEIRKQYTRYADKKLNLLRGCLDKVNRGVLAGPCPDGATAAKIQKARDKVDPLKIAAKCGTLTIQQSGLAGLCAGVTNAVDLAACIRTSVDAAVDAMIDAQYADAGALGPLPDPADQRCQARIARTMRTYAKGRLKARTKCQAAQDQGKTGTCPDAKTAAKLAQLAGKVQPAIEKRCTNAQVASLDAGGTFGGGCGGVTTTAALAVCERAEHDAATDALVDLLVESVPVQNVSVAVPPGAALLRVTLNGIDRSTNDLDIYLRQGAPPTTTVFDYASFSPGMFEAIEVASPAAGTWHVLVDTFAGSNVPFQLTITTFQP